MREVYISSTLRAQVVERAQERCEYCGLHSVLYYLPFHIDHAIPLKQGGPTSLENLAFACPMCNQYKGSTIATYLTSEFNELIPLYNPRWEPWSNHFVLQSDGIIKPLTAIGQGITRILLLNDENRVIERYEQGLLP